MLAAIVALTLRHEAIHVRLVTDEPEIALQLLQERQDGKAISDAEWTRLFSTEGYRRLKDREAGMAKFFNRPTSFTDDDFKKFMLSDDLLKQRPALAETLAKWKKVDVAACAHKSLAYLPAGAHIGASVYYLIKPRHNSFVWETDTPRAAVMLYLDPAAKPEDTAMTIAHEFHHIGFSSVCPSPEFKSWLAKQPKPKQIAYTWLGAFGEGAAVLASAGSMHAEPYQYSTQVVKDAFKKGVAHNPENMKALEAFFTDVLDGKLTEDQAQAKAGDFFGMVGPWYTTGWIMDTSIERAFGRPKLIACYMDPRLLLPTYNAAARKLGNLPLWPDDLVSRMS